MLLSTPRRVEAAGFTGGCVHFQVHSLKIDARCSFDPQCLSKIVSVSSIQPVNRFGYGTGLFPRLWMKDGTRVNKKRSAQNAAAHPHACCRRLVPSKKTENIRCWLRSKPRKDTHDPRNHPREASRSPRLNRSGRVPRKGHNPANGRGRYQIHRPDESTQNGQRRSRPLKNAQDSRNQPQRCAEGAWRRYGVSCLTKAV